MTTRLLQRARLENLCVLVTDGTHDSPKLQTDGVPFIKGKHISSGTIDFEHCDFITREDHQEACRRVKPQRGDILFSNIGSVGDTAVVKSSREFSIKNVALFRADTRKIDPVYLYYLVLSPEFRANVMNMRSGSAQPFISLANLRSFEVDYHVDVRVQRQIGRILSDYDDLIENNTKQIKILEEMARTIYREWFVEFRVPGGKLRKATPAEREITGKDLFPEGWALQTLGDVLELEYGKALKANDRVDGPVHVYGSSGVVGRHSASLVRGPGIIVGRKGNVGSVFWTAEDFFPIDTVFYVKSPVSLYYLYFNLKEQSFLSGDAAVPGLNRGHAYRNPITVPTEKDLSRFEDHVRPSFQQMKVLEDSVENLRRTRDWILRQLMSGETSVEGLGVGTSVGEVQEVSTTSK